MPVPCGSVIAVARSTGHNFSKAVVDTINLIAGEGVEGDAHRGVNVKHRSRVIADPSQPNLRQVHLIHSELFAELEGKGFAIKSGDLGENITTTGIDLLALPRATKLHIGDTVLEVTGLRNPCKQLNDFSPGLMHAVLDKAPDGALIRKGGIMAIVAKGGLVTAGNSITITLPLLPFEPLDRV
jgi:MOSC domain-containing protein YiiM